MPVYSYKGVDVAGRESKGLIDAESPKAARAKLRKSGVFPTDLNVGGDEKISLSGEMNLKARFERVKVEELSIMTRQLSTLIAAGIPVVDALNALTDQSENLKLKTAIIAIRERVTGGSSLADAMAEHSSIFSDLYINMVRAGETSGAMDLVLDRLADFTESQAALKSKVSSAMVYPLILLCVCILVLVIIFTSVIPKITTLFAASKMTLPLLTRILIAISDFLRAFWWLMAGALVIGLIFLRRFQKTPQGRIFFDRNALRLPIFGRLFRMVAVSRFARTLATLLKGGVPLLKAIDIVSAVVNNRIFSEVISQTRTFVSEGQSLAEPLKRSQIFPPMVTHMIAIGEKTGELENMLERVADAYDQQVNTMVGTLTALLEPLLILFMGGVVLIIVLSVLLPMLQMSQLGG